MNLDRRQPDEGLDVGETKPRKKYRLLGVEITRAPRAQRGDYFHVRVAAFVGPLAVGAHEVIYRQTGGDDFELYGVISHAGLDILLTVAVIVYALIFVERGRIR